MEKAEFKDSIQANDAAKDKVHQNIRDYHLETWKQTQSFAIAMFSPLLTMNLFLIPILLVFTSQNVDILSQHSDKIASILLACMAGIVLAILAMISAWFAMKNHTDSLKNIELTEISPYTDNSKSHIFRRLGSWSVWASMAFFASSIASVLWAFYKLYHTVMLVLERAA